MSFVVMPLKNHFEFPKEPFIQHFIQEIFRLFPKIQFKEPLPL